MIDVTWCSSFLHSFIYRGKATVEIRGSYKDEETKKAKSQIITIFSDIPCLLSPETKEASDNSALPEADKTILLFLDDKYDIPAHSRITVEQDGITQVYSNSGVINRMQDGHQEIELKLWEKWA